jgi:hypothetical protein
VSDATEREVIARIQRTVDDAYSRYAGLEEQARVDGLTDALLQALGAEPAAMRAAALDFLERENAVAAVGPSAAPPAPAVANAEVEELRRELERLRQAPATAATPSPGAPDGGVVDALLGADAERFAGSVDPTRIAGVVQALAAFAVDMVKGFLSAPDRPGDSFVQLDRFRTAVRGELTGSGAAGSTRSLLAETTRRVGVQLEAFSVACERGAKSLLGEISPELLEDQRGEGGFGPFKYRGMWETFARRHRELTDSGDLFENFFDPALRNAMYQLGEKR